MLWLIWQMWIFLFIAFALGLGLGWRLWSSSGVAGKALDDANEQIARLQRENDSLSKLAAQRQAALENEARKVPTEPAKTGAATKNGTGTPAKEKKAKVSAKPKAKSPVSAKPDDLTALKGLGPKAAATLNDGGVTTFAQIAKWTKKDVASWDEKLTARGRIERDDWVAQAKARIG